MVQTGSRNPAASSPAIWEKRGANNRSFLSLHWMSGAVGWQPNCAASSRDEGAPPGPTSLQAWTSGFVEPGSQGLGDCAWCLIVKTAVSFTNPAEWWLQRSGLAVTVTPVLFLLFLRSVSFALARLPFSDHFIVFFLLN